VIEALMEETEESCQIRDENKGIMAIYLKTATRITPAVNLRYA